MRLTKNMRTAFVRAAMDDVPQVDYHAQLQKIATDAAIAMMPPTVLAAYKKHPEFFQRTGQHITGVGHYYLPIPSNMNLSSAAVEEMQRVDKLKDAQRNSLKALESKINGAASACTTLKALKDMLPEFEKYMPADEPAACRTLPVVQNVVADFVKAGWPKSANPAPTKRRI